MWGTWVSHGALLPIMSSATYLASTWAGHIGSKVPQLLNVDRMLLKASHLPSPLLLQV